jgi:DNA replication protein DnaD
MEKECNKTVYNRVQHLINIKIAKALQTTSNEALCTLTGLTSITIKAEEAAKLNNTRKSQVMRLTTKYSQKTSFTQQTHSESLNNKMSTLYKFLQTAARASMGSELE